MARLLNSANSEYLQIPVAPVTAPPFTIVCWFKPTDLMHRGPLVSLGNSAGQNFFNLRFRGDQTGQLQWSVDDGTLRSANTTANAVLDQWQLATAVESSSSLHRVYLNGTSRGQSTGTAAPASVNQLTIGRQANNNPVHHFNGAIGEVAIYTVAFTDEEVLDYYNNGLAQDPASIHPEALLVHWPLYKKDNDQVAFGSANYNLNAFNTPDYGDHPPIVLQRWTGSLAAGTAPPANVWTDAQLSSMLDFGLRYELIDFQEVDTVDNDNLDGLELFRLQTSSGLPLPQPVIINWSVPTPQLTMLLRTDPITIQWTIPTATTTIDLQINPLTFTWSIPTPNVRLGSDVIPDTVLINWSVVTPHTTLTHTPQPASVSWSVRTPTIVLADDVVPNPAIMRWDVRTPATAFATTPAPASSAWSIPTPETVKGVRTTPLPVTLSHSTPSPHTQLIYHVDPVALTFGVFAPSTLGGDMLLPTSAGNIQFRASSKRPHYRASGMTIKAGREEASVRDEEVPAVDLTECLSHNELISSVNVSEITNTNVTIDSPQTNTGAMEIRGRIVEPRKAALFAVKDLGFAGLRTFRVAVTTNTNPPRLFHREVDVYVI